MASETKSDVRKKLRREGFKKEDIQNALLLLEIISFLDHMVFPDKPLGFAFIRKKDSYGAWAGYCPGNEIEEESYCIHMPGLSRSLKSAKKTRRHIFVFRSEKISRPLEGRLAPLYTWEEFLFSIAAHEVRHRIQAVLNTKKFSRRCMHHCVDPLKGIIEYITLLFKYEGEVLEKRGKSEEHIKSKTNLKEFDARVIEYLVAHSIRERMSFQSLNQVMTLVP